MALNFSWTTQDGPVTAPAVAFSLLVPNVGVQNNIPLSATSATFATTPAPGNYSATLTLVGGGNVAVAPGVTIAFTVGGPPPPMGPVPTSLSVTIT